MILMNKNWILKMIDAFRDGDHQKAVPLAHIVLEDYNLSDGHIRRVLDDFIPNSKAGFIEDNYWGTYREDATEDITAVINFLNYLLTIPEMDREIAMKIYQEE
jgi:hypothetical protein